MMELTKVARLLITIVCCVVVADMNAAINPNAETGASTQNHVIRGNDQRRVRSISTNSSPFMCADGSRSINRGLLCNGRIDCPDSSDENSKLLCNGTSCMKTYPCINGKCIKSYPFCDGVNDCGDNSDEDRSICAWSTSAEVVTCGNGQVLIGVNIQCNGVYNCMDRSDEFNCSKCPGQLMCDKGSRCVKPEAFCNRIQDCSDGADESCLILDNHRCNVGNFICPSGKCIHSTDICDGYNDCGDRSDEQSCPQTTTRKQTTTRTQICWEHTCPSGKCIPSSYVCDGGRDCEDGSDESGCSSTHSSTYSSTYTSYSYTKVAAGVGVPGGVVIFVGGCFGCFRRRRMRAITRTTTTTTIATAAVITTTAVASDLPPSYAEVVEASAPSEGIVNQAFVSSASVYK